MQTFGLNKVIMEPVFPKDLSTNQMYIVVGVAVVGGILFYLYSRFLMFFDKLKIRRKVRDSGGKLFELKYILFSSGLFGKKGERHYRVKYELDGGEIVSASCKTRLSSGVYWSGNSIPQFSNHNNPHQKSMPCATCGEDLVTKWYFCPNCGRQVKIKKNRTNSSS